MTNNNNKQPENFSQTDESKSYWVSANVFKLSGEA